MLYLSDQAKWSAARLMPRQMQNNGRGFWCGYPTAIVGCGHWTWRSSNSRCIFFILFSYIFDLWASFVLLLLFTFSFCSPFALLFNHSTIFITYSSSVQVVVRTTPPPDCNSSAKTIQDIVADIVSRFHGCRLLQRSSQYNRNHTWKIQLVLLQWSQTSDSTIVNVLMYCAVADARTLFCEWRQLMRMYACIMLRKVPLNQNRRRFHYHGSSSCS